MPPTPLWMASLAVAALLVFVSVTVVAIEISARSSSVIASGQDLLVGNDPGQSAGDEAAARNGNEGNADEDAGDAEIADIPAGPSGPDIETRHNRYDQAGVLPFLGGTEDWPLAVGGASPEHDEPQEPAPPEQEPHSDDAPHEQETQTHQIAAAHTVQPGETLWEIASIHDTTVDALLAANGLDDPDLIFAGAVLTIE